MRSCLALTLVTLLSATSGAMARDSSQVCDYTLHYDVRSDADGLSLLRSDKEHVRIEREQLWIDGKPVPLTQGEQRRLRHYARDLRRFTQEASSVALEGVQIGLEGASVAVTTLTGKPLAADTQARMQELQRHFAERFDGQYFSAEAFGPRFDREIDASIEELVDELTEQALGGVGSLLSLALFAPSRLEARAAQVEQQVTQQIQVRADVLERRAEGLCKQVQTLDGLENSLGRFDLFSVDGPSI
jgi:hypothetical protein